MNKIEDMTLGWYRVDEEGVWGEVGVNMIKIHCIQKCNSQGITRNIKLKINCYPIGLEISFL